MADEAKLRDQIDRGGRAALALKELDGTFKALEEKCWNTFQASDLHDDKGRLMCRLYLQVMRDVKERLEFAIRQGDDAQKELMRMKDQSKLRTFINARR